MTRKELFGTMVGNVTNFSGTAGNGQVTLTWADPEDTIYEEVPLTWAGTRILRKEGSCPVDENDGIIVVDSKNKNQYSSNGFVDTGLSNTAEYYYQAFPYTIIYNLNDENTIKVTLGEKLNEIVALQDTEILDANHIFAMVENNEYIFVSTGNQYIKKINKSTLEVVATSERQNYGILAFAVSGDYIYAGGLNVNNYTPIIYKYNISDLSLVATSESAGSSNGTGIKSLAISSDYIYAGGTGPNGKVVKFLLSDLSYVTASPTIGDMDALAISGDYIYAGFGKIYKCNLSDLNNVATSPSYSGNIRSLAISGNYIYAGGDPGMIKKYQLSDLSYVAQSATHVGISSLCISGDYIYTIGGKDCIRKYSLSDFSCVAESIDFVFSVSSGDIIVDGNYIYFPTDKVIKCAENVYVLE